MQLRGCRPGSRPILSTVAPSLPHSLRYHAVLLPASANLLHRLPALAHTHLGVPLPLLFLPPDPLTRHTRRPGRRHRDRNSQHTRPPWSRAAHLPATQAVAPLIDSTLVHPHVPGSVSSASPSQASHERRGVWPRKRPLQRLAPHPFPSQSPPPETGRGGNWLTTDCQEEVPRSVGVNSPISDPVLRSRALSCDAHCFLSPPSLLHPPPPPSHLSHSPACFSARA